MIYKTWQKNNTRPQVYLHNSYCLRKFHDMKREKINRKNAGKFKVKIAYVLNKYITTPKKDVLWEEHISQKDKNKTQKIYL